MKLFLRNLFLILALICLSATFVTTSLANESLTQPPEENASIPSEDISEVTDADTSVEISIGLSEAEESDASFDDSDVPVEKAAPDYSIIFTLAIGCVIGGLILYILFKPNKR